MEKNQVALTENIKRYIGEWQIKEVNYQPYQRQKPNPPSYQMPLIPTKIEKRTILFHQSFKLEYEQNGSLTLKNFWDPRKFYFRNCFLPEKWVEIENALQIYNDKSPNRDDTKKSESKKNPSQPNEILIIGAIILLTLAIILSVWLVSKKKKNNTKKSKKHFFVLTVKRDSKNF